LHSLAGSGTKRYTLKGREVWPGSTILKWRDIEGIEDWLGSTIAQSGLKWSRKIQKE
jgi:hypothetical protein